MNRLNYFVLFISVFVGACKMDGIKQKGMVGTYKLTAEFDKDKIASLKEEVETSIANNKKDLEDAKINYEINGEKGEVNLTDGINKVLNGVGKMVEGIADIGSGALESFLSGLDTEVSLEENGEVRFRSKNLNVSNNATFWKIQDGDFVISDKNNKETARFKIETEGTDTFLLKNDDISFRLKRIR